MESIYDNYRNILRRYWGYDDFRGIQREIIESIGRGNDTMGLMPTGGGKSIAFQVPAMAMEGLCLVISPLIALMKDQVANLRRRGIKAEALYMGMRREEVEISLNNCIFGPVKFLYVSPERLASEMFLKKLSKMRVTLITVDEAHCISQWGYDFRPHYLQIAKVRRLFPRVPILALTATATPDVCDDVMNRLEFSKPNLIRMSFRRDNIVYVVRRTEDVMGEILHILSRVPGCAIIYMRNRDGTMRLAQLLSEQGVSAIAYHAGLDRFERETRQKKWMTGEVRVMVATNAFGMGIDKPDVRLVIHAGTPDSPEEYFQEAGRAGRDGQTSYAVLLTISTTVASLSLRVAESYPPPEEVKKVYEHLCYYYTIAVNDGMGVSREFDVNKFCLAYRFFPTRVISCLKLLQLSGYIGYDEESERQSRILFLIGREKLYQLEALTEKDDEILRTILRLYGGVFTDFIFISEPFVAQTAGVADEDVHQTLITLSRRGIITYIPCRKIPRIVFCRRRPDSNRIIIPTEVYGERLNRYRRRIEAMIGYISETSQCRSTYLLDYLGEKDAPPCRRCDVCQTLPVETDYAIWQPEDVHRWVDEQLQSGEWFSLTSIYLPEPQKQYAADYLQSLVHKELLEVRATRVRLKKMGNVC